MNLGPAIRFAARPLGFGVLAFAAGYALARRPALAPGSSAPVADVVARPVRAPLEEMLAAATEAPADVVARHAARPPCAAQAEDLLRALLAWAETEPEAALREARRMLRGREEQGAVSALLAAWARRDAAAAWGWARVNAAGDATELDAVLSTVGAIDAESAWGWARSFAGERPDLAQAVYAAALRGMNYAGNFEAAASLLAGEAWPASADAAALAGLLGGEWARHHPERAAAWAAGLPAGEAEAARVNVVQSWMESDPAGASRHALVLPDADARPMLLTQAVTLWLDREPAAALAWLDALEPGPDHDEAMAAAAILGGERTSAAIARANEIFDPETRLRTLGRIIVNWRDREPAAAVAWLEHSPDVPAEIRRELRERIEAGTLEKD